MIDLTVITTFVAGLVGIVVAGLGVQAWRWLDKRISFVDLSEMYDIERLLTDTAVHAREWAKRHMPNHADPLTDHDSMNAAIQYVVDHFPRGVEFFGFGKKELAEWLEAEFVLQDRRHGRD